MNKIVLFVYHAEIFNTNISHQLFDYKITLVNLKRKNINSKGDYVLKNWFESSFYQRLKLYKNKFDSDLL